MHTRARNAGRQTKNSTISCLQDSILYTKFLKDNVINFLRRKTRLAASNKQTSNKANKKGEFKEPAARLIQAGGGNKSKLICSGSTTGEGAKQLINITNILESCNADIQQKCKPHPVNQTTLDNCEKAAKLFNTTINKCVTKAIKGDADSCSCFQTEENAKDKKILQDCKGKDSSKAAKARQACQKVVSKCKQAVTTAGTLQYACKYTKEELLATLKQLSLNSAAFKGLMDKIKELTGLEPNIPGSNNRSSSSGRVSRGADELLEELHFPRVRGKRQAEVECSTVVSDITSCTTAISNTPTSTTVATVCQAMTYTVKTCTDADKASIQTALDAAVEANSIIIAFTASIKSEIEAVTGAAPTDKEIEDSPAPGGDGNKPTVTTQGASRNRASLRRRMMDKMQL